MPYQEKRSIAHLIGTVMLMTGYIFYTLSRFGGGALTLPVDLREWSKVILIFMGISIAAMILLEISLAVGNAIVTRKKEDPDFSDERDRLIELKAARISYGVVGGGFILSLVSLVLGMTPFVMLNIVLLSFHTAEIAGSGMKIIFYRRGV